MLVSEIETHIKIQSREEMEHKVKNRKLLFVEDDRENLATMKEYFQQNNTVFTAKTLQEAKDILASTGLDAIILDVILPDGEGLQLLQNTENIPPTVILSDLAGEEDILAGFASGAADYVAKPCSMKLLETRLALRLLPPTKKQIVAHHLILDTNERTVIYKERNISLTSSEFNILHFLMTHAGEFFNSTQIYENVWNAPSLQTTTIKRHLSTLRCKLREVTNKNLIITEFGKGYCFIAAE